MTTRADFLAVLLRNSLRMDSERRAFAHQVDEVVRRHTQGRQTFDALAYALISRDIERVFDAWYGRFPDDQNARFLTLIIDGILRAKSLAVQRAVEDITRRLPETIVRAIQKEAA